MSSGNRYNSLRHAAVNARYLSGIMARKPLFLMRVANNYARALASPDRPPIRLVDVAVTYDCNMDCVHCSAKGLDKPDVTPMGIDDYALAAEKLLNAGALVVNFTGGEPLLNKDLNSIIKIFQPSRTLISISTNGALLTEDKLRELKEIGVDSLNISLDSCDRETHDAIRRCTGSHEKALSAARMAGKMGFRVNLCYVLTSENIETGDREQFERLGRKMGVNVLYNIAVPVGAYRDRAGRLFSPRDRLRLNQLMKKAPWTRTDQETNYFRRGCGAVKEKAYVTAYGEVMPCPFIQVSFGSILDDDFEAIRDNALAFKCFREYAPVCIAAEDADFISAVKCYGKKAESLSLPLHYSRAFRKTGPFQNHEK